MSDPSEQELTELMEFAKLIAEAMRLNIERQLRIGKSGMAYEWDGVTFSIAGDFRPIETALAIIEAIHEWTEQQDG